MTRFACLSALAALSLVAVAGARAEDAPKTDPVAQRLFAGQAGAKQPMACFTRVYDAAHLSSHPRQKVAGMMVLFSDNRAAEEGSAALSFKVGFKMRGGAKFDNGGDCSHAGAEETGASSAKVFCSIDCDGGGLDVEISADNKSLRVGLDGISVYPAGASPDEDNRTGLPTGSDDKVFRLERASLADCLPLAQGKAQIAMMRRAK
jgi:hypothetical protein